MGGAGGVRDTELEAHGRVCLISVCDGALCLLVRTKFHPPITPTNKRITGPSSIRLPR